MFAVGIPKWLVQSLPYIEQRLLCHSFRCTHVEQTTSCRLQLFEWSGRYCWRVIVYMRALTSPHHSVAFASTQAHVCWYPLRMRIELPPKDVGLDRSEPPWVNTKAYWQQVLVRRLETTRAEFDATIPPSGRIYADAPAMDPLGIVSLSPRDPVLQRRAAIVA